MENDIRVSVVPSDTDPDVTEAVAEAAQAACRRLDSRFPGGDKEGISSNFQGLLEDVIMHMLKGHPVLSELRGHRTHLPRLIISESFFGTPIARADHFLVTVDQPRPGKMATMMVLDPASEKLLPLAKVETAFSSFAEAARAAIAYLRENGIGLDEAKNMNIKVRPVVKKSGEDGYLLK